MFSVLNEEQLLRVIKIMTSYICDIVNSFKANPGSIFSIRRQDVETVLTVFTYSRRSHQIAYNSHSSWFLKTKSSHKQTAYPTSVDKFSN